VGLNVPPPDLNAPPPSHRLQGSERQQGGEQLSLQLGPSFLICMPAAVAESADGMHRCHTKTGMECSGPILSVDKSLIESC